MNIYFILVIKCDIGEFNEGGCKCCPGYGVKESGIFYKRYSCESKYIFNLNILDQLFLFENLIYTHNHNIF